MSPDEERWSEALTIERMYEEDAPAWIARRIGALALEGDFAGVIRFQAIAWRIAQLHRHATPS